MSMLQGRQFSKPLRERGLKSIPYTPSTASAVLAIAVVANVKIDNIRCSPIVQTHAWLTRRVSMAGKQQLKKSPTGIIGLDQITEGGLPAGRPTLICGSAGCGKTLMAMEFLVRGATEFGEPGAHFAFEETPKELTENVRSLGFDLDQLQRKKLLHVEYVHIEPAEVLEAGEYDLEGLFI